MPFTRERMGSDDVQVALIADTPQEYIDLANVNTNGTANIVITPADFLPGEISDADLLDLAMFVGVLLENTDDGYNLEGDGLHWYLGDEDDGGDLYTGADLDETGDLEAFLDAQVFPFANGLTKGSVNAAATSRTTTLVDGDTRMALLQKACRTYATPDYEYRINPDGTVDVDTAATLFTTTPEVLLAEDGGRDGAVTGLASGLVLPDRSIRDFRTDLSVNWNGLGTFLGTSSPGVPAGKNYVGFDGADIVYRSSVQKSPRNSFREASHRGTRFNARRYSAYGLKAQAQAANLAASLASQAATAWYETQADIDEYDPCRFVVPGDYVWAWDMDLGLVDTANEVYYRGQAVHPKKERVEAMTCPILPGYGVYLRVWDGAAFDWYRLTPYVQPEDGPTTLELGVRANLRDRRARPDRINRRRYRRQLRQFYILDQFYASL